MKFDRIEYDVAEMAEAPESLIVDGTGAARFASHSNRGALDRPEIGLYQHTISADDLAAIERLVTPLGAVASIPDHMGKIASGDRYRRLVIKRGAEAAQKAVGTRAPVDARLSAIFAELDGVAQKLLAHPRAALGIAVGAASMGRDKVLRFELTLSARGSEAVVCRSPVALVGAPDGWVSVQLWPNVPVKTLGAGDIHRASAAKVDDARKPPSFAATLELAPGASATFRVEAKLPDAKRGASVIRVSVGSFAPGPPGRPWLVGEVQSKTVDVEVPAGG